MVHPRFYEAIAYLFPSAKLGPLGDILVQDDGDGKGRQLLRWDIPAPIPTDQQVIDALATIDSGKATTRARADAFKADIDRKALINAIKNATPAQIKTYINNNVTDLASARTMLYRLTLLVALTLKD